MREGLAALTVRGRAFLAAGITAIVCAILLGQPALTRVGVLVAVLPLVTAVVLGRSRYKLSLTRTVTPQLLAAGESAQVEMTITNEGRTPSGVLMLEDQVPFVLGSRPRFVLAGMAKGWRRTVSYQVRSDVRGRFEVGPMVVRVSDPFGLVELGRAFHATVALTVTPRTVALPPITLGGGLTGSGDNRARAFATGSAEDVTVRDYRQGDDLRRVHWASSARFGELMVRREEQPWQSRATVVLDNRVHVHGGRGVASSLEAAVSTAASIAVHLVERGFRVRLVTADGEATGGGWHERARATDAGALLEALALVQPQVQVSLDTSWLGEQSQGGLLVAVLGDVEERDLPVLRRMQQHTETAYAVALDVGAWGGAGSRGGATAALTAHGWRVAGLQPHERLEEVWETLGRGPARAPAAPRGPETSPLSPDLAQEAAR